MKKCSQLLRFYLTALRMMLLPFVGTPEMHEFNQLPKYDLITSTFLRIQTKLYEKAMIYNSYRIKYVFIYESNFLRGKNQIKSK